MTCVVDTHGMRPPLYPVRLATEVGVVTEVAGPTDLTGPFTADPDTSDG